MGPSNQLKVYAIYRLRGWRGPRVPFCWLISWSMCWTLSVLITFESTKKRQWKDASKPWYIWVLRKLWLWKMTVNLLVKLLVNVLVNYPCFGVWRRGGLSWCICIKIKMIRPGAEAQAVCRVRWAEQAGYRIPRFGYVRLGDSQTPDKIRKARV